MVETVAKTLRATDKENDMTAGTILLIAALICFVLAAVGVGLGRINLTAAGLACVVGAVLAGNAALT